MREREEREQEEREQEDDNNQDNLDKFIKIQKSLFSEKSIPKILPKKMETVSLENIPEISRRVGTREQKSMLTSKKTLGKCFGLFK